MLSFEETKCFVFFYLRDRFAACLFNFASSRASPTTAKQTWTTRIFLAFLN